MENGKKKLFLASERGFCSGVKNALALVEKVLASEGKTGKICVLHEIVHNDSIVRSLREKGIVFVEEPEEARGASCLIFSAHGVSLDVERRSGKICGRIVDATCPIVKKLHRTAEDFQRRGLAILLLGKRGHRETEGIAGRVSSPVTILQNVPEVEAFLAALPEKEKRERFFGCLSQTTMSADEVAKMKELLRKNLSRLEIPADVCYATKRRQNAVKALAEKCDMVFVAGSEKSSNSRRLAEIVRECGKKSLLVPDPETFVLPELASCSAVGISSGASAPEEHVRVLVEKILKSGEFELEDPWGGSHASS